MFGGTGNNKPLFPTFLGENKSTLPQLQLFGDIPAGANVDPTKFMGNDHAATLGRPTKRGRDHPEITSRQQKLHVSLNNYLCQDEGGLFASNLNPNPVSTGLKLSYEEDEHNSTVTSASENLKGATLLGVFPLANCVKIDLNWQKEEFDRYIRVQEENMVRGVRDLNHRHTTSLLNALESHVNTKLREKELEIDTMNRKNKELGEKIKQITMEAQSWHYRAKYNESIVNALKTNLQQVMAQAREGCGESGGANDAASSYANPPRVENDAGFSKKCRLCKFKDVCVLLFPCRHLCVCRDCERFVEACPVCQMMKTASVQVYMS